MDRKNLLKAGRRKYLFKFNHLLLSLSPANALLVCSSLNVSSRSLLNTSRTLAESSNYALENYGTSLPVAVIELIGSSDSKQENFFLVH